MAAGQLTYLQLINRVLMRLGKTQIGVSGFTSLPADSWGGIVKEFVNDAQQEIAKEHDWSTLYVTNDFTGTAGSRGYDLSSDPTFQYFLREYADLLDVTNRRVLTPVTIQDIQEANPGGDAGTPTAYTVNYPNVWFDRMLEGDTTYRASFIIAPPTLTTSTDTSYLPEYCDIPIIWWVTWQLQASREDSQDNGENARAIYTSSLARAIGQDRRRVDFVYAMQPVTIGRARPIVPYPSTYPGDEVFWDGGP